MFLLRTFLSKITDYLHPLLHRVGTTAVRLWKNLEMAVQADLLLAFIRGPSLTGAPTLCEEVPVVEEPITCGVDGMGSKKREATDTIYNLCDIKHCLTWEGVKSSDELFKVLKKNPLVFEEGPLNKAPLSKLNWFLHNVHCRKLTSVASNPFKVTAVWVVVAELPGSCTTAAWVKYPNTKVPEGVERTEKGDAAKRPLVFKKPSYDVGLPKVYKKDCFSPLRKSRIYIKSRFSRVRQWCRPIVIWSLWLNIALLFFCHAVFYGIKFKVGYTLQLLYPIVFVVALVLVLRRLKSNRRRNLVNYFRRLSRFLVRAKLTRLRMHELLIWKYPSVVEYIAHGFRLDKDDCYKYYDPINTLEFGEWNYYGYDDVVKKQAIRPVIDFDNNISDTKDYLLLRNRSRDAVRDLNHTPSELVMREVYWRTTIVIYWVALLTMIEMEFVFYSLLAVWHLGVAVRDRKENHVIAHKKWLIIEKQLREDSRPYIYEPWLAAEPEKRRKWLVREKKREDTMNRIWLFLWGDLFKDDDVKKTKLCLF